MRLSVSLPAQDVAFLDEYTHGRGLSSGSASMHEAVRCLRNATASESLGRDYESAWTSGWPAGKRRPGRRRSATGWAPDATRGHSARRPRAVARVAGEQDAPVPDREQGRCQPGRITSGARGGDRCAADIKCPAGPSILGPAPSASTGLPRDSKAQAEQVRAVDAQRVGVQVGDLDFVRMAAVDDALRHHLGRKQTSVDGFARVNSSPKARRSRA